MILKRPWRTFEKWGEWRALGMMWELGKPMRISGWGNGLRPNNG